MNDAIILDFTQLLILALNRTLKKVPLLFVRFLFCPRLGPVQGLEYGY